jgi:hypothetical protein
VKLRSKTFYSFIVLAIIYASVNLIATPPRATLEHFHVSSTTLRVLDTTVVCPVILIWFIGLYGYQKLRTYSSHIKQTKDGQQVMWLTRGVMVLAYWLPVSSTLSALLSLYSAHHHAFLATTTILTNYLSLLFPLFAFTLISKGGRQLSESAKQRPSQAGINIMALILIIAGVIYGYLVASARESMFTVYHMPMTLVLASLVVPYVYCWYLGLLSAYDIHIYTKKVRGIIYRKGWNALSFGIVWIILFSIALQYLTTVSARLGKLSLGWTLALVYTILPIMALGYIFVALGAKKLMKIEEA